MVKVTLSKRKHSMVLYVLNIIGFVCLQKYKKTNDPIIIDYSTFQKPQIMGMRRH